MPQDMDAVQDTGRQAATDHVLGDNVSEEPATSRPTPRPTPSPTPGATLWAPGEAVVESMPQSIDAATEAGREAAMQHLLAEQEQLITPVQLPHKPKNGKVKEESSSMGFVFLAGVVPVLVVGLFLADRQRRSWDECMQSYSSTDRRVETEQMVPLTETEDSSPVYGETELMPLMSSQ